MRNNGDECSLGVFSFCDASVGNSNYINIPQKFNLNNNFIKEKNENTKINNNYVNSKLYNNYENPVIDLTDSLSEIPEEIKTEQLKNDIKPSMKMAKYLENTVTEKMKGFSDKKLDMKKNFIFKSFDFDLKKNHKYSDISNNQYENENCSNNIVNRRKSTDVLLNRLSSEEEIYDNGYGDFINDEDLNFDSNNNRVENDENLKSDVNLKYNNFDTQSFWRFHRKNSVNRNQFNNLEKKLSEENFDYIIKTEDNDENIEDLTDITNNKDFNLKTNNVTTLTTKRTELESREQGIKILKTSNNVFIEGIKSDLRAEDYIYDNSIKITKYLSEGAQAKVYLGHIEEINKYVAIKRYSIIDNDDNLVNKVNLECEFIKSLDHPNIIKYYDIDINYRNNFTTIDLIMEYVDGYSLKDYVHDEDFVYLEENEKEKIIKYIIRNVLNGIDYLHSNKFIHRDIKVNKIKGNNFNNIARKHSDFKRCRGCKNR